MGQILFRILLFILFALLYNFWKATDAHWILEAFVSVWLFENLIMYFLFKPYVPAPK